MSVKKSISETSARKNSSMLPLLRGMFIFPEIPESDGSPLPLSPLTDLTDIQVTGTAASRFLHLFQTRGEGHETFEGIHEPLAI